MIKSTTAAIAALAILFGAGAASAQKIDANGRCHDASGKFAKAEVCGGATATKTTKTTKTTKSVESAAAPAAATAPAAKTTTTTAKTTTTTQKCKNDKGKYAKCGTPGAHPA
ncbi:hypothetical protein [Phenylobacterium sp.]|jgi:hypothetical protein|uniref:hypothetical protein n=1 Tax=Phenylobacterium sp. TaxID=1871053 RepID=UPI002F42F46D